MKSHILIIVLFFKFKFTTITHPECFVEGDSIAFIKGTLKIKLKCNKDLKIKRVGVEDNKGIEYDLISINNKEILSFYSRYFLNFNDTELNLMNIDRYLEDTRIYFYVKINDTDNKYFYSLSITIINRVVDSVNYDQMIESGRYFTQEYIYDHINNITIPLDEIEQKYGIKFFAIYFFQMNSYSELYNMITSDLSKLYKYKNNIFYISKKTFTILEITDKIKEITIGFLYIKDYYMKFACLKQINIMIPLDIINKNKNIVSWKLNSIFFHTIQFWVFTIYSKYPLNLLSCNNIKDEIICEKGNGYKNLFSDVSVDGLQLNEDNRDSFILKIHFNTNKGRTIMYYDEEIYIEICEKQYEINYFDLKESQFRESVLKWNMENFYNSGILKIKLENGPEFIPNKARFVEFFVKFKNKYASICTHYGDNFEEEMSVFSPFILSCKPKSIAFYDIDIELFNNVQFAFRVRINSSQSILIVSQKLEIINGNRILKPYKKISSILPISFLRKKNRFFDLSYKLGYSDNNQMDLQISHEDASIVGIGLCCKNNTCKFEPVDDDIGSILSDGDLVNLQNRTILIIGNPFFLISKSLLFLIFNGRNIYSEGIHIFEIDQNIIEHVSCDGGNIIWKINNNKIKFYIYLENVDKQVLLGECSFTSPCIEYSNDYIQELTLTGFKINNNISSNIFNLKFEINSLISAIKSEKIIYRKTYDLMSEDCKDLTQRAVTLRANISKDLVLRNEFYINKNKTIILLDESKKKNHIFFIVMIAIILPMLIFIVVLKMILLYKKRLITKYMMSFEIRSYHKK